MSELEYRLAKILRKLEEINQSLDRQKKVFKYLILPLIALAFIMVLVFFFSLLSLPKL